MRNEFVKRLMKKGYNQYEATKVAMDFLDIVEDMASNGEKIIFKNAFTLYPTMFTKGNTKLPDGKEIDTIKTIRYALTVLPKMKKKLKALPFVEAGQIVDGKEVAKVAKTDNQGYIYFKDGSKMKVEDYLKKTNIEQ